MATVTLRDLYAAELHDLLDAEKQIAEALPLLAGRATSSLLRDALEQHHAETKIHVERLQLLLDQLNEPRHGVPSVTAAALLEDARHRLEETERGETLDAALIAAAQRIEHYEIASYGTARSYAESLGDYDAARILQQTLDEEGHADHTLTRLAERGINRAASEDLVDDPTRYRSRLRYVACRDLPGAHEEGELHLHNREGGGQLGTLDGFILESQSGRPVYYVIDSRGWFAGGRYVIPVGQIEADESTMALHTTLTRVELSRYPEFSPSAFTAMDDSDAARYERRLHRAFAPDAPPYEGRPLYEDVPLYRTPRWPRTTGEPAAERPSAQERTTIPEPLRDTFEQRTSQSPEHQLMMARGDADAPRDDEAAASDKPHEPRIERYPDR